MIYLVSLQNTLFEEDETLPYRRCTIEDSLNMILNWDVVEYDSETTGRDPHICKLLCVQFGNRSANCQIVVDTTTIDICAYKKVFETKLLIGHNLKFDFQFLYKFNIVPSYCYDTMIVEQLLHLGYDNKYFRYSLKAVAERRLGIDIDKSTRGEIIWRGLDSKVIVYAAGDVQYLEDIRDQQLEEARYCKLGVDVENNFVPVIAYLEYSGFHLDEKMWRRKMQFNEEKMHAYMGALNEWVIEEATACPEFKKYTTASEEDLFADMFPTECTINWSSPLQVTQLAQELGFDTKVEDKKTGESKDSIVEKQLTKQVGICDDFLNLYFQYQEAKKECSTYGSNYLDAINPLTGRLHTTFKQLGASSGRMSCGSTAHNTDLAKLKGISESRCIYPQIQNLPSKDEIDGIKGYTRHCFTAMDGNLLVACDFSALESRLGADIYNEPAMIKEYNEGSGDIHSLTAKICFKEELRDVEIKDIKKLRPDLRQKAKGPESTKKIEIFGDFYLSPYYLVYDSNGNWVNTFWCLQDLIKYSKSEYNTLPVVHSPGKERFGKSLDLSKVVNAATANKPYKGLFFKRVPKSMKISCANGMNSWKAEMPIMSLAKYTYLEGAETTGEVESS